MKDASLETSLPPPAGTAVPQHIDEVTPAWLTACLRHAGALGTGQVRSFTHARVGQGKGFAGHLARIQLQCDEPLPETPRRLIAKFASEQDVMRGMMADMGGYEREVRFYRELADRVGVPTPRCYLAHYDQEHKRFLLLLEDMAPAASPGVDRGLSLEQARVVMEQLARLHARWWNRTDALPWLELDDDTIRQLRDRYQDLLPEFVAQFGDRYPTVARVARGIGTVFDEDEWVDDIRAGPRTLAHNDMHVENIFLPTEDGGRFAFIDWQGVGFGRHGIGDVTRILCMGMRAELRRAHADELLRCYHDKLTELGVTDYPFRTLKKRYREEMMSMVIIGVLAFAAIDFEGDDSVETQKVLGERIEVAVRDAKVSQVLALVIWLIRIMRFFRRLLGRGPVKRL